MGRFGQMTRDDSGIALPIVIMASVVLFLLAATVVTYASLRTTSSAASAGSSDLMNVADAGINEYVYQLSQDPLYAVSHPTMSGTVPGIGTWVITATANSDGTWTLRAVSTLLNGKTKRLICTVFPQSFADYVVLVGSGDYSIGADATFGDTTHPGKVRSNANIRNAGVIYGLAEAHLNCLTDSGGTPNASFLAAHYPGGVSNGVAVVDFSLLSTNWNELKSYATGAGTYYGASGVKGYKITMTGNTVTIDKVTAGPNTNIPRTGTPVVSPADPPLGTLTTTNVVTGKAIPAKGVFFFDDTVWVAGNYSSNITIMTSGTMYCADDVVPTDPNVNVTCGLLAKTQMLFPYWYTTMPSQQTVQAATLCQSGGIGPDSGDDVAGNPLTFYKQTYNSTSKTWSGWTSTSYTPALKSQITIKGARAMNSMIGFSSGYNTRLFTMDPHLANNPPPKYPTIPGGVRVTTWQEY